MELKNEDMTDEQNKDVKDFLESLNKDYRYNIESFDKQAIYIASGALAISLTFVKNIVPIDNSVLLWLFFISISFFALSILLSFLSFLISSQIINNNIEFLKNPKNREFKNDKITTTLNWVVAGLVSIGIILIVIYTISNMSHCK